MKWVLSHILHIFSLRVLSCFGEGIYCAYFEGLNLFNIR